LAAGLLARIPDKEIATGSAGDCAARHISQRANGETPIQVSIHTISQSGRSPRFREHNWLTVIGQNAPAWMTDVLALGLGIVALALFSAQRQHLEYLWIFSAVVRATCILPLIWYEYFHNVPANWDLLRQPLVDCELDLRHPDVFCVPASALWRWIQVICAVAMAGQVLSQIGQLHGAVSRVCNRPGPVPAASPDCGRSPRAAHRALAQGQPRSGDSADPLHPAESCDLCANHSLLFGADSRYGAEVDRIGISFSSIRPDRSN
jgi:hypothetical protein